MSAWLGRAALLLGRPGGPAAAAAAAPSSCLGSLRGPPRCCCRRRLGSLRGGAEGLLLPWGSPPPGRALGTHPKKEPMEALNTAQGARDFIYSLHSTERSCLLRELHRFESIAIAQEKLEVAPPSPGQLKHGNPNRVVNWSCPRNFNYGSLAGYVEALASRLGLSIPDLTPKQADMWQTRLSAHLLSALGSWISVFLQSRLLDPSGSSVNSLYWSLSPSRDPAVNLYLGSI
ncbi:transmembrane protein 65 isoform X7 [Calonectris borealis]|uniref:transmembrane protein 65 isoform X7 n=1 Tax=Calonectris borealis TaxID=1323832 RepID=UPI003F4B795F